MKKTLFQGCNIKFFWVISSQTMGVVYFIIFINFNLIPWDFPEKEYGFDRQTDRNLYYKTSVFNFWGTEHEKKNNMHSNINKLYWMEQNFFRKKIIFHL